VLLVALLRYRIRPMALVVRLRCKIRLMVLAARPRCRIRLVHVSRLRRGVRPDVLVARLPRRGRNPIQNIYYPRAEQQCRRRKENDNQSLDISFPFAFAYGGLRRQFARRLKPRRLPWILRLRSCLLLCFVWIWRRILRDGEMLVCSRGVKCHASQRVPQDVISFLDFSEMRSPGIPTLSGSVWTIPLGKSQICGV
jgi:hypothetical protein